MTEWTEEDQTEKQRHSCGLSRVGAMNCVWVAGAGAGVRIGLGGVSYSMDCGACHYGATLVQETGGA
jgi:hypothetical protein